MESGNINNQGAEKGKHTQTKQKMERSRKEMSENMRRTRRYVGMKAPKWRD